MKNKFLIVSLFAIILAMGSLGYTFLITNQLIHEMEKMTNLMELLAPAELETIIESQKEGKVVIYASWRSEHLASISEMFKAKYPWIEVEWLRGSSSASVARYQAEVDAGVVNVDILGVDFLPAIISFKEEGHIMNYESPEYVNYPEELQDFGYWVATRVFTICIMYNLDYVDEVTSWTDLLKPEFKDKIALEDPRSSGTGYANYFALRQIFGIQYWEQMAEQNVVFLEKSTPVAEDIASGEKFLGQVIGQRVKGFAELGAPVKGCWPEEGVAAVPGLNFIVSEAPHPNSAKLFLDFLMSIEIAEKWANYGYVSTRVGASAPEGLPSLADINIIPIDWAEYVVQHDELLEEFKGIFGLA